MAGCLTFVLVPYFLFMVFIEVLGFVEYSITWNIISKLRIKKNKEYSYVHVNTVALFYMLHTFGILFKKK